MKNPVLEMFFTFNISENTSKCNVDNCNKNMTGKHSSNLEKHIFSHHKKQFNELQDVKNNKKIDTPESTWKFKKQKVSFVFL